MAASMVPVASVAAAQNKNPPKTDANKTEEPSKKTDPLLLTLKSWCTTFHFVTLFCCPILFYMDQEWGWKFSSVVAVSFFLSFLLPPIGFIQPDQYFSPENCPPPMPKRSEMKEQVKMQAEMLKARFEEKTKAIDGKSTKKTK